MYHTVHIYRLWLVCILYMCTNVYYISLFYTIILKQSLPQSSVLIIIVGPLLYSSIVVSIQQLPSTDTAYADSYHHYDQQCGHDAQSNPQAMHFLCRTILTRHCCGTRFEFIALRDSQCNITLKQATMYKAPHASYHVKICYHYQCQTLGKVPASQKTCIM